MSKEKTSSNYGIQACKMSSSSGSRPDGMQAYVYVRSRMSAAFRTGWACFLVAMVMEFGNMHVRWMSFPVFSYIVAVTIVGESTLGKAMQDARGAFLGILQGVGMAFITLHLLPPRTISQNLSLAITCIFLTTFLITYPHTTHPMTKRVAMAETAIIFINAHIQGPNMNPFSFPLHVAATAAVGAACAVVSVMLPLPHLASSQIYSQAKLAARVTCERVKVLVDAFCTEDRAVASSLFLHAKSLGKLGSTALCDINAKEGDINWEIPECFRYGSNLRLIANNLSSFKKHLMAIELAVQTDLANCISTRSCYLQNNMLKNPLIYLCDWISIALMHVVMDRLKSTGEQDNHKQIILHEGNEALTEFDEALHNATTLKLSQKLSKSDHMEKCDPRLPEYFFLFAFRKFVEEIKGAIYSSQKFGQINVKIEASSVLQTQDHIKPCCSNRKDHKQRLDASKHQSVFWMLLSKLNYEQFRIAVKASSCMALATFMGSLFNKSHGYWADITIAMGFGLATGGSFKMANLRLQGTVVGSMYGLLAAVLIKQFPYLRMLALIPWVAFTTFLRKSKIFESTGALSAFTGAIVILGRRHKESDVEFTIVRVVEAFLGLASFVLVELVIFPRRASSLARSELITGLNKMRGFVGDVLTAHCSSQCLACSSKLSLADLKTKETTLLACLQRQTALIKEAAQEPDLWFTPFPASSYFKIVDVEVKILDLLQFALWIMEDILKTSTDAQLSIDKLYGPLQPLLALVKEKILPIIAFLEQALASKTFDNQGQQAKPSSIQKVCDEGNEQNEAAAGSNNSTTTDFVCKVGIPGEKKEVAAYFLETASNNSNKCLRDVFQTGFEEVVTYLREASDDMGQPYVETHVVNSVMLSMSSLAFIMQRLVKEISELEKAIHELMQVENPWSLIHFSTLPMHMGHIDTTEEAT